MIKLDSQSLALVLSNGDWRPSRSASGVATATVTLPASAHPLQLRITGPAAAIADTAEPVTATVDGKDLSLTVLVGSTTWAARGSVPCHPDEAQLTLRVACTGSELRNGGAGLRVDLRLHPNPRSISTFAFDRILRRRFLPNAFDEAAIRRCLGDSKDAVEQLRWSAMLLAADEAADDEVWGSLMLALTDADVDDEQTLRVMSAMALRNLLRRELDRCDS